MLSGEPDVAPERTEPAIGLAGGIRIIKPDMVLGRVKTADGIIIAEITGPFARRGSHVRKAAQRQTAPPPAPEPASAPRSSALGHSVEGEQLLEKPRHVFEFTMFGPSDGAWSGSSCVSMKRPATPTATAARASVSTNSRWPPVEPPCPPGCCNRMRGIEDHRRPSPP